MGWKNFEKSINVTHAYNLLKNTWQYFAPFTPEFDHLRLVLTHVIILAILLEIVVIVRIVLNLVIFTAVSTLVANLLGGLEDFYDNYDVS